ncbi:hypothetical protein MMC06_004411 [Schaereria dolodes]|nr:hypothetical protein [Schaereria dolodes]
MTSSLYAFCFLCVSYLVAAQSTTPSATLPAGAGTTTSDYGIFQLVTPTTHRNQVPASALSAFEHDASAFYQSYTSADPFVFMSALVSIDNSPPPSFSTSVLVDHLSLQNAYSFDNQYLLQNPTSYLSKLQATASPWPSAFSSSIMSHASGILLGYESLVSKDVLSLTPSFGPVTPGMSAPASAAITTASAAATKATAASGTSPSSPPSPSTSKAAAAPIMIASPLLIVNAAAVAAGMLGVVYL